MSVSSMFVYNTRYKSRVYKVKLPKY